MASKLEEAARVAWFDFVDQQGYPNGLPTWDEMGAMTGRMNRQDEFRSMTRAVVEALREPSAGMIGEAGAKALNRYIGADPADSYYGTAQWADECWKAMCDHVLSEPTAPAQPASREDRG